MGIAKGNLCLPFYMEWPRDTNNLSAVSSHTASTLAARLCAHTSPMHRLQQPYASWKQQQPRSSHQAPHSLRTHTSSTLAASCCAPTSPRHRLQQSYASWKQAATMQQTPSPSTGSKLTGSTPAGRRCAPTSPTHRRQQPYASWKQRQPRSSHQVTQSLRTLRLNSGSLPQRPHLPDAKASTAVSMMEASSDHAEDTRPLYSLQTYHLNSGRPPLRPHLPNAKVSTAVCIMERQATTQQPPSHTQSPNTLAQLWQHATAQNLYVKLHADKHLQVKLHAGRGGLGEAHLDIYRCIYM